MQICISDLVLFKPAIHFYLEKGLFSPEFTREVVHNSKSGTK